MSDPYQFLLKRFGRLIPERAWQSGDSDWVTETRKSLLQLLGVIEEGWPDGETHVGAGITEEDYSRFSVTFPSREGWNASGYLIVPQGQTGPLPAVICLPGHGAGANAIVGLVEEPYQANFALQCVRRGWIALVIEQVSFGQNRSATAKDELSSCYMDSLFAIEVGETMTGWRVRDAIAGARFLRSLPQVSPAKIGVMGISGGGQTALWTAALDESICAAGVSGYFTPMSHSILRVRHCADNYIPGLANVIDVPDLSGLIAPRWLGVENGTDDEIFNVEGFRLACARAGEIYSNYPSRFSFEEFAGGHKFVGTTLFRVFEAAFSR